MTEARLALPLPEELRMRREEVAELLEKIARDVRADRRAPDAVFVQVMCNDGSLVRSRNVQPGFNMLNAIGVFECLKAQCLDEILGTRA